jgi:hypothetical protein
MGNNCIENESSDIDLENPQSNMNINQFKGNIENGVLGLDRDVYLSLIKFLNSSTVRKV